MLPIESDPLARHLFSLTLECHSIEKGLDPAAESTCKVVCKALKRAAEINNRTPLSQKTINRFNEVLSDLSAKVDLVRRQQIQFTMSHFKPVLTALFDALALGSQEEQETKEDTVFNDVVVLKESEFGRQAYDHVSCTLVHKKGTTYLKPIHSVQNPLELSPIALFPSSASSQKEYLEKYNSFGGCVEILTQKKLANLLTDIYLDVPSNTEIVPRKVFIPDQALLDLPRHSRLIVNQKVLYDKTKNEILEASKEQICCAFMEALDQDVDVMVQLIKLTSQASFARPLIRLYKGFECESLDMLVGQAMETSIIISTEKSFTIFLKAFFKICSPDERIKPSYVGIQRKIVCDKEFLLNPKVAGNATFEDVYSPRFSELAQLRACDFEDLLTYLKAKKAFVREASRTPSPKPTNDSCLIA